MQANWVLHPAAPPAVRAGDRLLACMTRLVGLARIAKLAVDDTPTSPQSTETEPGVTGWQFGVARMGGWS